MSFPFEGLTDYETIEFLERLDDETLYTMCANPISKRVYKICKMNGNLVARVKEASKKEKLKSIIIRLLEKSYDLDRVPYNWNLVVAEYSRTKDSNVSPVAFSGDNWFYITYDVYLNTNMEYDVKEFVFTTDESGNETTRPHARIIMSGSLREVIDFAPKFLAKKYSEGFKITTPRGTDLLRNNGEDDDED